MATSFRWLARGLVLGALVAVAWLGFASPAEAVPGGPITPVGPSGVLLAPVGPTGPSGADGDSTVTVNLDGLPAKPSNSVSIILTLTLLSLSTAILPTSTRFPNIPAVTRPTPHPPRRP